MHIDHSTGTQRPQGKELESQKVKETETYSFGRMMKVALQSKKATLHGIQACIFIGGGKVIEKLGMKHQGKVTQAKGWAKANVTYHVYAQAQLGKDSIVASCINVGKLKQLNGKEDLDVAIERFQKHLEKNRIDPTKYGLPVNPSREDIKDLLKKHTLLFDGVCKGACLHLIGQVASGQVDLKKAVEGFEKGVPIVAAANQCLYSLPKYFESSKILAASLENYLVVKGNKIPKDKKTVINEIIKKYKNGEALTPEEQNNLEKKLGSELFDDVLDFFRGGNDKKPLINGLIEEAIERVACQLVGIDEGVIGDQMQVLEKLGPATEYKSSEEHLKNIGTLDPGTYQLDFATGKNEGGHAIAFFVEESPKMCHIFDPNIGLIQCEKKDLGANLVKLFTTCYPPPDPPKGSLTDFNVSIVQYSTHSSKVDSSPSIESSKTESDKSTEPPKTTGPTTKISTDDIIAKNRHSLPPLQ